MRNNINSPYMKLKFKHRPIYRPQTTNLKIRTSSWWLRDKAYCIMSEMVCFEKDEDRMMLYPQVIITSLVWGSLWTPKNVVELLIKYDDGIGKDPEIVTLWFFLQVLEFTVMTSLTWHQSLALRVSFKFPEATFTFLKISTYGRPCETREWGRVLDGKN